MKKILILIFSFGLLNFAFADNYHGYEASNNTEVKSIDKKASLASGCEIEIINYRSQYLTVTGHLDNGLLLDAFNIYPNDAPHYIGLGYGWLFPGCYPGAYLVIYDSYTREMVFSGYLFTHQTLNIVP